MRRRLAPTIDSPQCEHEFYVPGGGGIYFCIRERGHEGFHGYDDCALKALTDALADVKRWRERARAAEGRASPREKKRPAPRGSRGGGETR